MHYIKSIKVEKMINLRGAKKKFYNKIQHPVMRKIAKGRGENFYKFMNHVNLKSIAKIIFNGKV